MRSMLMAGLRMTADEFLIEDIDPWRNELVDGEVVVHPRTAMSSYTQGRIVSTLHAWSASRMGRGLPVLPLGIRFDERNVHLPDLLWYAEGRAPERDALPPYPLPNLAIEVRSPSTWRYDIGAKKSAYERAGLAELWLVDTAASEILIFRRSSPPAASFDVSLELAIGEELTSPQLPGFSLALSSLFAD
jgi:Uma2 family endonuclease